MANTMTPVLNLVKPEINGPHTENTWGYDINQNFDKLDSWSGAFAADVRASSVLALSSRAGAIATQIPSIVMSLQLAGYAAPGDGGEALYTRSSATPSHTGKFQSLDGAWWEIEKGAGVNLLALATPDRAGVASATPAFQAALNATVAGERLRVIVPAGTYNLVTSPVVGAGIVDWDFLPGVVLTGAGVLPFHAKGMLVPSITTRSRRQSIWHGTVENPMTDGPDPVDMIYRVDNSVSIDDPSSLLHVRFTGLTRLAGGRGWIQANKTVVEDQSTSAATQSVASANVMYKFGQGAGWGLYSECHGIGAGCQPVSCELNVSNYTDTDYLYNEVNPIAEPASKGLWVVGFGDNINSFAIGVGAGGSNSKFGAGLFLAAGSIMTYGIDIQSIPTTGIRIKYGAPGGAGVGIDFGQGANYFTGTLTNGHGCMNIWNHLVRFGPTGSGWMCFNPGTGFIEFGYNGVVRRTLDLTGAYVPL